MAVVKMEPMTEVPSVNWTEVIENTIQLSSLFEMSNQTQLSDLFTDIPGLDAEQMEKSIQKIMLNLKNISMADFSK